MIEEQPRTLALDIIQEVMENGGYTHQLLAQVLDKYGYLPLRDRRFISRLVRGTVERSIELDAWLNAVSKLPTSRMKPYIRNLLRMSVYQMLYMDSVPVSAACNEAVKMVRAKGYAGLSGFVNGVLRNVSRLPEDFFQNLPIQTQFSMPDWIWQMWISQYGQETAQKIMTGFFQEGNKGISVRVVQHLTNDMQTIALLQEEGIQAIPDPYIPHCLHISNVDTVQKTTAFQKGWITVQDGSSILAVEAAGVQKGQKVVDVCAAPGGKSLHIADLLAGTGVLLSRDRSEEKCTKILENLERCHLNLDGVQVQVWDGQQMDPALQGACDTVLIDAPCSGLGIIGSKPDIKYHASPEGLNALAELQKSIVKASLPYVRPGGRLVYSTCTLNQGENEEMRHYILSQPLLEQGIQFEALPLSLPLPAHWTPHAKDGYLQLFPGIHSTEGFFISTYRRLP